MNDMHNLLQRDASVPEWPPAPNMWRAGVLILRASVAPTTTGWITWGSRSECNKADAEQGWGGRRLLLRTSNTVLPSDMTSSSLRTPHLPFSVSKCIAALVFPWNMRLVNERANFDSAWGLSDWEHKCWIEWPSNSTPQFVPPTTVLIVEISIQHIQEAWPLSEGAGGVRCTEQSLPS